jgi:hypothetical protein
MVKSGELLGEGKHIRIHGNVTVMLLLLRGQVRVNAEVTMMLLFATHGMERSLSCFCFC